MNFTIPVQVVSEANQRDHFYTKNRRKKAQQDATALFCRMANLHCLTVKPSLIRLTRLYPKRGKVMDMDNLAGSFKGVADAIARELDIDDGDLRWEYAQEEGADEYGVRVELFTTQNGEA